MNQMQIKMECMVISSASFMSGQRIKLPVFILSFKEILNNILSCDQGNPSLRGNKYF